MLISFKTILSLLNVSSNYTFENLVKKLISSGIEVECIKKIKSDSLIEIKTANNRNDLTNHFNIAQEVAAMCNIRLKNSYLNLYNRVGIYTKNTLLKKQKCKNCTKYASIIIKNVQIGPSFEKLSNKLISFNIRPKNNVEDILVWQKIKYGHSFFVFDYDKILNNNLYNPCNLSWLKNKTKIVKTREKSLRANLNFKYKKKNKEPKLTKLVNFKRYRVNDKTKNILLELQYSTCNNVHELIKHTKITEQRNNTNYKTNKIPEISIFKFLAELVQKTIGGSIEISTTVLCKCSNKLKEIKLNPGKLPQTAGIRKLNFFKVWKNLETLQIQIVKVINRHLLIFLIPTNRSDISNEIDIIEEAIRVIGFDKIPIKLNIKNSQIETKNNSLQGDLESTARLFFSQAGYYETINYSFDFAKNVRIFSTTNMVTMLNPLSEAGSTLQQSLMPGLLKNLSVNLKTYHNLRFFEIGRVFSYKRFPNTTPRPLNLKKQCIENDSYINEIDVISGIDYPGNFFLVKNILENFFKILKIRTEYSQSRFIIPHFLHPTQSATLVINNNIAGYVGFLHPMFKNYSKSCVFSINTKALNLEEVNEVKIKQISKFPGIKRDLSFITSKTLPAGRVINTIKNFEPLLDTLEKCEIFDIYHNDSIGIGKKTIGISIFFRSLDKTLLEHETDEVIKQLIKYVTEKLNITFRKNA